MKTIKALKFVIALVAITTFILILKSCKKVDNNDNSKNIVTLETIAAEKEAIKKSIQAEYGDVSAGFVYNINKTADNLQYKNAAGKMININAPANQTQNNSFGGPVTNGGGAGCYTCTTATNVSQLKQVYTLDYVQRFYMCEGSSDPANYNSNVLVSWTVSVPYNFVSPPMVAPPLGAPPTIFNTISLRITPAGVPVGGSGSVVISGSPNCPVYTLIGTDPTCGNNRLYSITYKFLGVANSYFKAGATLEAQLEMNNDCALVPGKFVSTGFIAVPGFCQNEDQPCNRIDKVYINTGTGPGGCTTASGNYGVCFYPTGLTPADQHQVEYRQVTSGGTVWDNQTGSVYWGVPVGTTTMAPAMSAYSSGILNLTNMLPGTGVWLVRYRNVKTSVCDVINPFGPPNGTWPNPSLWFTKDVTP